MANTYYTTEKLSLTAFVGNEKERNSLQITMKYGNEFACLNEDEAFELAINILLRVKKKVTATGCEQGLTLK